MLIDNRLIRRIMNEPDDGVRVLYICWIRLSHPDVMLTTGELAAAVH